MPTGVQMMTVGVCCGFIDRFGSVLVLGCLRFCLFFGLLACSAAIGKGFLGAVWPAVVLLRLLTAAWSVGRLPVAVGAGSGCGSGGLLGGRAACVVASGRLL